MNLQYAELEKCVEKAGWREEESVSERACDQESVLDR